MYSSDETPCTLSLFLSLLHARRTSMSFPIYPENSWSTFELLFPSQLIRNRIHFPSCRPFSPPGSSCNLLPGMEMNSSSRSPSSLSKHGIVCTITQDSQVLNSMNLLIPVTEFKCHYTPGKMLIPLESSKLLLMRATSTKRKKKVDLSVNWCISRNS